MKRCPRCEKIKAATAFYVRRSGSQAGQLSAYCKPCTLLVDYEARQRDPERRRESLRRYAATHSETVTASRRRWAAEHPDAHRVIVRAHAAVARAVRRGELIRPEKCEECGGPGRRIEAAHHDYTKPLDVRWLCSSCHRRYDKHPKRQTAVGSPVAQSR